MKSVKFFSLFLILLVACTVVPPKKIEPTQSPSGDKFLQNPSLCNADADCTCGGIDKKTDNCFVGNKLYASKNVDMSKDCPDFCTGIAAHLETKCVSHECKNVPRPGWNQPKACTEEAKVCPDGSAVGRTGPNCEFAPCPGEGCSANSDCVPDQCCHASGCVSASQAPKCDSVACTMNCAPGTLDCGGACACENNKCVAKLMSEPSAPADSGSDLSNAHWLCEDSSWKETPEGCFENTCFNKGDCQLMGIKDLCGPRMIAGPTQTLHKPPVFYADRCGAEHCSGVGMPKCMSPESQPRINGFDCVDSKCVVRTVQKLY